ncbi:unnamed protein product [Medioppia subpectinata]|uniref:Protein kinase domain-containing protein n=1 Tax=Medioppia subpectinata TaxID=1979941 RepID=A0A7R9L4C8_9ACAR|nr:unnamed protein product [Medioppia subpectinata]CAG2115179.1 unnamed protein product [Medioppia subpectinata]
MTNCLSKNFTLNPNTATTGDNCGPHSPTSAVLTGGPVSPSTCHNYELLTLIGEGTYGQVFKAQDVSTGRLVAIKKIINRLTSDEHIRNEINLLDQIRHRNIVQLIDRYDSREDEVYEPYVSNSKSSNTTTTTTPCHQTIAQYLVFEFCDFDLHQLLYDMRLQLSLAHIKNILRQILKGMAYMHDRQVLHRDVKPENILVNARGKVRIADFGFAQCLSGVSWSGFSAKVVTLAYRAPELLVGYRFYGTPIDMWSVGCLMAEFWTRAGPLMDGDDERQQLIKISRLCGPINSVSLLGVRDMYFMSDLYLPQMCRRRVRQMFAVQCVDDSNAVDLFDRLLSVNVDRRITAAQALQHPLFAAEPKACDICHSLRSMFAANHPYNSGADKQCNSNKISNNYVNNKQYG